MSSSPLDTEHLGNEACMELLQRTSVGRLAVDIGGRPEIFPINYVMADGAIVFRTAAGTKLAGAALLHHVAFEIDGFEPSTRTAWSVIVKGWAREIEHPTDRDAAEQLPLFPWVSSDKPNFVRIDAHETTGRRFLLADDVLVDESIGWSGFTFSRSPSPLGVEPAPGTPFHPGAPRLHPD
ncbi:MAG: pyridoxamine 5'-phosphate oxidase family protein [Ilumatobacteraceae bacterium]